MTLTLTTTAFPAGGKIPRRYTCDGEDISPPLEWRDPPEGTKSFVLIMDDPDAPRGTWLHWVLFDLPASASSIAQAVPAKPKPETGGSHAKNSWGRSDYGGPCPPSGTHRYFFHLYALNAPLSLAAGASLDRVWRAMEGRILGEAELMGTYAR
ncbi:MAG: YbhB/YbcL family Raf kinase inhibitor-like protein [Anaerolineales bacterium]